MKVATHQMNKMSFYVYPYKSGSRSASALSAALGGRVLRREGSKFVPGRHRKVINWGSSSCPYECLNQDDFVALASNKLAMFNHWKGDPWDTEGPRVPQWTASQEVAQGWLSGGRGTTGSPRFGVVVARQTLCGHSGQGIVIRETGQELPKAPLYVEYVPKDAEYRVHVFNNEVIDVQRKIRDPEVEPKDWAIRSRVNGFIFTRSTSDGRRHADVCPPDVLLQATRAMGVSGLVFGGVDVIWNEKRSKAFCLEINSACGLEGSTPEIYANAVRKYYES